MKRLPCLICKVSCYSQQKIMDVKLEMYCRLFITLRLVSGLYTHHLRLNQGYQAAITVKEKEHHIPIRQCHVHNSRWESTGSCLDVNISKWTLFTQLRIAKVCESSRSKKRLYFSLCLQRKIWNWGKMNAQIKVTNCSYSMIKISRKR